MNRYDPATAVWTAVLGALAAAVIDWIAVVNPARAFHPLAPDTTWWTIGLALACVPPICWLVGGLRNGRNDQAILWGVVLVLFIVLHVIPLQWAQGQS